MSYSHDMKDEKVPTRKVLIPEGWRNTTITACVEKTSKSGNNMFVFTFFDKETKKGYEVYSVAEQKKRWLLKMILTACNIPAGQDGVYNWDIPDVLNKDIVVLIEHEENKYIDRNGEARKEMQHRVVEVKKSGEDIDWEE